MIITGKPTMKLKNKTMMGFSATYEIVLELKIDNKNSRPRYIRFQIDGFDGHYDEPTIEKLTKEDSLFHFINSLYIVADWGPDKSEMKNIHVKTLINYINSLKEIKIDCDPCNDPKIFKVISVKENKFHIEELLEFTFY